MNYDDGELLAATARRILDEALALDPFCPDARRLVHAQDSASLEDHLQFLEEGLPAVRRDCEARAAAARRARIGDAESEVGKIAAELALAPCQRWLQSLAELSLLGGRYGRAIDYARECLALDPKDPADARWTAALAFAKLDDGEGLVAFVEEARLAYESRPAPDAWLVIARLALAWKAGDDEAARNGIGWLLATYPMAGTTLTQLAEVPEPMFARLAVAPHSEDELVMAVSEAAVLFQEGADESGLGPLGAFVVHDPRVEEAFARERELFGEEERADEDAPAMGSEADEGDTLRRRPAETEGGTVMDAYAEALERTVLKAADARGGLSEKAMRELELSVREDPDAFEPEAPERALIALWGLSHGLREPYGGARLRLRGGPRDRPGLPRCPGHPSGGGQ